MGAVGSNRYIARNGAVIRADVHIGPDGRPKGSGIVVFESPDDARNAIQQFNGYDWQGRVIEVREDRYAGSGPGMGFGGRGGYGGGMRGGFGGGFGGRGGFGGGRGGFGGGFGRGGFGGGAPGGPGFEPPASSVPPNPFTDFATAGTERGEIIYVRNVRLSHISYPFVPILISYSYPGRLATTTWLSCSPPSERSSKLRSSTSLVVVLVVLAWFDSIQPRPRRLPLPSFKATSMVAVLSI